MIATALTVLTLAAAPTRIQVAADEFRYSLSRQTIKAGPAIVQLANYGEDEHVSASSGRVGRASTASERSANGVGELEARFLPGRFRLWCSLADHRSRGMSATLLVKRA